MADYLDGLRDGRQQLMDTLRARDLTAEAREAEIARLEAIVEELDDVLHQDGPYWQIVDNARATIVNRRKSAKTAETLAISK